MSQCSHNCSDCSQAEGCADQVEQGQATDFSAPANELSHVKKVIGVVSGKGGVGKSMVASLLAVLMNRHGYKTAILDADITGPSIPKAFGLREKARASEMGIFPVRTKTGIHVMSLNLLLENETDPVVWRGPIIASTVKQFWTDVVWGDIDILFVDMPPGTGDVPLTVFQSLPVDGIIAVTTPQDLVSMIVAKAANMARLMDIPLLALVENMSYVQCPDCDTRIAIFGESRLQDIAAQHGIRNTARLPLDPHLSAACDRGMIELFKADYLDGIAALLDNMLREVPND